MNTRHYEKRLPAGVRKVRNLYGRVVIDGKRICSLGYETPELAASWRAAQIAYHRDKRVAA